MPNKEWLANSVKEGFIEQYLEEDLLDRTLLGHGGYGVVYKAKIKQSGVSVAIKPLFLNRYGREEELYKKFVKEVATY
ncbi:4872_t:CDS:2 [Paraglomus occultum]|uniref:4872_t:CDS:1 n=1 Tax=Paraglomus occultum TaxID=144539 RepID=A0A9N8ZQD7_9GLOM|nr:4872_t:CDS:2 [Paraglomus occultum]